MPFEFDPLRRPVKQPKSAEPVKNSPIKAFVKTVSVFKHPAPDWKDVNLALWGDENGPKIEQLVPKK